MPIWWDPTAGYPPSAMPQIVEQFEAQEFDFCIFYAWSTTSKGPVPDVGLLPVEIVQELAESYRQVDYDEIIVFVRNEIYNTVALRAATSMGPSESPLLLGSLVTRNERR